MNLRLERAGDEAAIAAVTAAAFAGHPYSNQTEPLLVELLRRDGGLLLSLVAEDEGAIVGHIAFSPVAIAGADLGWVGMGPLSVAPGRQRRGIGSALVRAGLEELRRRGVQGCVLVGEPGFYGRFGFQAVAGLVLDGVPPEVFLALPFGGDVPHGTTDFHPAFATCIGG